MIIAFYSGKNNQKKQRDTPFYRTTYNIQYNEQQQHKTLNRKLTTYPICTINRIYIGQLDNMQQQSQQHKSKIGSQIISGGRWKRRPPKVHIKPISKIPKNIDQ